jgi:hypothetical protein
MFRPRFAHTIDWRHAVTEFVLIVAGVLVALAANSWWESRRDHDREHVYLVQLLADTHENAVRVGTAIAEDSALQRSTRRWTAILRGSGPPPPADSLPPLGGGSELFRTSDFRPLLGTYAALVETGDLQLLRSPALRFRLVAYQSSLETVREILSRSVESMERDEDSFFRVVIPLRAGGGPGPDRAGGLVAAVRGREDVLLPIGAAAAVRGRRLRALRSLRTESQVLEALIRTELAR